MALAGALVAATAPGAAPATSAVARCLPPTTLTPERLAERALVVPAEEGDLHAVLPGVRAGVGGIILLGSAAPVDLRSQLAALAAAAPSGIAPWVMVDEEGGAVQRLANLVGGVPAARTLGATERPAQITAVATTLGRRLAALGISMDLAPVLDADGGAGPNSRDADGTRSFSADPATAAADGIAFAEGLANGGVVPVVKHFPGLGGASGNTDLVVASTRPWGGLRASGLVPFADAVKAHLPAVMVANAAVPGLSALPASLSPPVVTGLLRGRLGFRGLVLSDSLSAVSVSGRGFSLPAAAVSSLAAGADLVLYNATAGATGSVTSSLAKAIVAAVGDGRLHRPALLASLRRSLAARGVRVCPR